MAASQDQGVLWGSLGPAAPPAAWDRGSTCRPHSCMPSLLGMWAPPALPLLPGRKGARAGPLPRASVQVTFGPRKPSTPTRPPCTPLSPSVTSTAVATAASQPRALTGPWTELREGSRCAIRDSRGHTVCPQVLLTMSVRGTGRRGRGGKGCLSAAEDSEQQGALLSPLSSARSPGHLPPGPAAPPGPGNVCAGGICHTAWPCPSLKDRAYLPNSKHPCCPHGVLPPLLWTVML